MKPMDERIGQRFLRFFGLGERREVDSEKRSAKETDEPRPEVARQRQQPTSDESTVERYRANPFLEEAGEQFAQLRDGKGEDAKGDTKDARAKSGDSKQSGDATPKASEDARPNGEDARAKGEDVPAKSSDPQGKIAEENAKAGEDQRAKSDDARADAPGGEAVEQTIEVPRFEEVRLEEPRRDEEPKAEEPKAREAEEKTEEVRSYVPPEELEQAEARETETDREEEPEREKEEQPEADVEEEEGDDETLEWKGLRPSQEPDRHEQKMKAAVPEDGPPEPEDAPAAKHEEVDASQVAEEATSELRRDEVTEKTAAFVEESDEPEHRDVEEAHQADPQQEERDEEDRPGGGFVREEAREEEAEQSKGLRHHVALGDENRCHGTTADGSRCLRKPVEGKAYCREHFAASIEQPAAKREPTPEPPPIRRGNFGSKIIV